MTEERPTTRRELLKPVQLLGFAFAAAAFSGFVTLFSMGFFTEVTDPQRAHIIIVTLVVTGIAFIVTLVVIALLMLAVDPAQVTRTVDKPVLHPDEDDTRP